MKKRSVIACLALASLVSAAEAEKLVFVPATNTAYLDAVPGVKTRLAPKYQAYLAEPANQRKAKAQRASALIDRYAPEWKDEFRRHDAFLGWEEDAFAVLSAGLDAGEGCTSWVVLPPNTADGKMLASYDRSVQSARTLLRQGRRAAAEKLLNDNFRTNAVLAWDMLNKLAEE